MVAPVNSSTITTLQRATPVPNQAVNRQVAQAVLNKTPSTTPGKATQPITLASANATPNANLPRGSIVDKLV